MAGKPSRRQVYTIACRCGTHAAVHLQSFGRPQVCRTCKVSFTVVMKKDARTGAAVPVAVAQARKSAQKESDLTGPKLILVCACGYRRAVPPDEAARNNRCPGCGKWMFVEKPASSRAARKPTTPPLPPRPAPPPEPRSTEPPPPETPIGLRALCCPCGERLLVRLELLGKEARCPRCHQILKIEGFRDPQTFVTQIRAIARSRSEGGASSVELPSAASLPPALKAIPALPLKTPPAGATEVACSCGQKLYLLPNQVGKEIGCPTCGRIVQVQKRRDPQTLVTVIRPVFRDGPPSTPSPTPPPAPVQAREESVPLLESLSSEAPLPEEEAENFPAKVTKAMQEVICKCGEELLVGPEDAGRHVQCPSCGVLMEVEQSGGALRVNAVGKMDDGTWSLEDFS